MWIKVQIVMNKTVMVKGTTETNLHEVRKTKMKKSGNFYGVWKIVKLWKKFLWHSDFSLAQCNLKTCVTWTCVKRHILIVGIQIRLWASSMHGIIDGLNIGSPKAWITPVLGAWCAAAANVIGVCPFAEASHQIYVLKLYLSLPL